MNVKLNALWLVAAVLVVLWLFGVALKLFGALIHLLLLVAVVLCVLSLLVGRRISR